MKFVKTKKTVCIQNKRAVVTALFQLILGFLRNCADGRHRFPAESKIIVYEYEDPDEESDAEYCPQYPEPEVVRRLDDNIIEAHKTFHIGLDHAGDRDVSWSPGIKKESF